MAKENPIEWLKMEDIYGNLANSNKFGVAFCNALSSIWKNGTEKTMNEFLQN
jgi:mannitol 2-dehydrogenase